MGKNYKNPVYDPAKSTFSFPVRLKVLFTHWQSLPNPQDLQLAFLCFSVPSFVTPPFNHNALPLSQVESPEAGIDLEFEVWDKDTLSSDDLIGKVVKVTNLG